jgi:hypothetical protein
MKTRQRIVTNSGFALGSSSALNPKEPAIICIAGLHALYHLSARVGLSVACTTLVSGRVAMFLLTRGKGGRRAHPRFTHAFATRV